MVHLLSVLLLSACGRSGSKPITEDNAAERFADALCSIQFDTCGCEDTFFSEEACPGIYALGYQRDLDDALEAGLSFDGSCLEGYLELLERVGCRTPSELVRSPDLAEINRPTCKAVFGDGQVGDECTSYYVALGDSCAQGLSCFGTCFEMPASGFSRVGEPCGGAVGRSCELGARCDADPATPEVAGTCVSFPGLGQECFYAGTGCAAGLRCDETNTCAGPGGRGESCDFQAPCQRGFACDGGTCVDATSPGDPCDDDDACGIGFTCDEEVDGGPDVCVEERPVLCY